MSWPTRSPFAAGKPARTHTLTCRRPPLRVEPLEDRVVPALTIQIDYSFDSAGFFNDPARRAILQQAANDIGNQISTNLAAVTPGGANTNTFSFFNPATGGQVTLNNYSAAANTITIYAGGRDLPGTQAGVGGNGGWSGSGSQDWLNLLQSRGSGGFALLGGSLAVDTAGTNFYFGSSPSVPAGQVDFYSVVSHELGHVLGLGTSTQWSSKVANGVFTGSNAVAVYGGGVPVSPDGAHWADGVAVGGQRAVMDPVLQSGQRVTYSALDYAALRDIGWSIGGAAGTPSAPTAASAAPTVRAPSEVLHDPGCGCGMCVGSAQAARNGPSLVALTGVNGTAQLFQQGADGTLAAYGPQFTPFPGYNGPVRTVVADFNGDGYHDVAFATGAGINAQVHIVDGHTFADILGPTQVLGGFGGGVFVAAGDVDRDGVAELAVSADSGGSVLVSVYKVGGGLSQIAMFYAFGDGDSGFRGGSRVAMGDINSDGAADLVVGAGVGGGPAVATFDGTALARGQAVRLIPDFFALDPGLRSGVFVSAGDINGDGYGDIIYSTGISGGPRVRIVGGDYLVANPGLDASYLPAIADFFAFDPDSRDGTRVAARDLDGDGKAELVVSTLSPTNNVARILHESDMSTGYSPKSAITMPFGQTVTTDGIYVG